MLGKANLKFSAFTTISARNPFVKCRLRQYGSETRQRKYGKSMALANIADDNENKRLSRLTVGAALKTFR